MVIVAQASPTITTTPNPSTVLLGGTLQDVAFIAGGFNPTGSITFSLYAPGVDPTVGPAAHTEMVTVSGNGTYDTTVGFVANAAGTWHWVAAYNGDSNNNPASSGPLDEPVTVPQQADLILAKQVDPAQVSFGSNVVFTLIVHNNGPDAATDVVVTEPLPPGLFFVSASGQGTYDPAAGVWTVGTLPDGATATLQVVAQVIAVGPIVNSATAGADQFDPNLSNNTSIAVVTGMQPGDLASKRLLLASSDSPPPEIPFAVGGEEFVVGPDRSLWEESYGYVLEESPPGTILSVSAAQTAQGLGAFAVASDLSLWQFVGGAWTMLSPAGTILAVSAAPGEQVFAVTTDHSLWEHSGYGWQMLSPAGTIQGVSASSGAGGAAVAFALAWDSSLWQYAGGWTMLSPAGTIRSISAGTRDDVFAVAADQSLWEFAGGGWTMLSPAGTILSIQAGGTDATGADVVFALASDHSLWADGGGGWGLLSPANTIAALDTLLWAPAEWASSNTQFYGLCVTAWDGSCWYFDAPTGWAPLFP